MRANKRAFKQTPDILNVISVNVTSNPFVLAVIHCLASCILVCYTLISRPIIGVYCCIISCALLDKLVNHFTGSIVNNLKPISVALCRPGHKNLVAFVFMPKILAFATKPSLFNFYDPAEKHRIINSHGISDSMAKTYCLVRDIEHPFDLIGRYTFLRLNHHVTARSHFHNGR